MRRALARVGLVLALAGCGGHAASGPAWPRSAGRVEVDDPAQDGGESLEPQQAVGVAAIERADDRTPAVSAEAIVVDEEVPPAPAAAPAAPADGAAAPTPPVGEVQIEVIELNPEDIDLED